MSELCIYKRQGYTLGSAAQLLESEQERLIELFQSQGGGASGGLAGRAPVQYAEVGTLGDVVIKHYVRGGLLRHLRSSMHLHRGLTRSQREFDLLSRVRSLGVSAPEPLVWAWRGRGLYRAWLVTRAIPEHRSLAQLSHEDPSYARELTATLMPQIEILVRHGIFHIDLHPGNVIVDRDERVYIVDFDKAQEVYGNERRQLPEWYLRRWRRAVIKHALPEVLTEVMCSWLRRRDFSVSP